MMNATYSPPKLNDQQIAQYKKDGYTLVNQPVLDGEAFARLKARFEELLVLHGPDHLDVPHFQHPELLEFLLSKPVLDLIEPIVGPNIGLWSSHFISKDPFKGKATPWHEDSSYWNGRVSTMEGICTLWLAIDRATPENGSMAVVPGTQQNGFSDYEPVDGTTNIFNTQIKDLDESKAVFFTLDPNECSLHEGRIIHGAHANTSPNRRAGYTMRYFPTTSKVYPEKNQGHRIWLARGVDVAGNHYENA